MIEKYRSAGYVPDVGTKWKHYKTGTIYTVLDLVTNTETEDLMVVYTDGFRKWARPLREDRNKHTTQSCWNDIINDKYRFEEVSD